MIVLSLFDGISCGQLALKRAGVRVDRYYASEIEPNAIKVTQHHFPDTIQLGDVTRWREWNINWASIDLLIGGSPCQGFSIAGKKLGFDDSRSRLFFDFVDILDWLKAKNPNILFLLENVSMTAENEEVISSSLSVPPRKINSDLFVAQNRPRSYWFNWQINALPNRPQWNEQYYQWRRTYFRKNKSGVCPCLTANMGTGGHNVPLKSMDLIDKLSPVECERLQTLPDDYTKGLSNSQRYKTIGNGWTVDVVAHIFKGLRSE